MSPVLVRLFRRIVGASCKRDSEGMPFVAFFGIEELACLLAAHLAGRMLVVGTRFAGGRGRRRGWRRSGRRVAGARGGRRGAVGVAWRGRSAPRGGVRRWVALWGSARRRSARGRTALRRGARRWVAFRGAARRWVAFRGSVRWWVALRGGARRRGCATLSRPLVLGRWVAERVQLALHQIAVVLAVGIVGAQLQGRLVGFHGLRPFLDGRLRIVLLGHLPGAIQGVAQVVVGIFLNGQPSHVARRRAADRLLEGLRGLLKSTGPVGGRAFHLVGGRVRARARGMRR